MELRKRGELTSAQIIGLILVIAGFVILLLFLPVVLDIFEGTDNRELCKLSVISRATTPSAGQELLPLRCTTEKICIGEKGDSEECRQFAGEDVSDSVNLKGDYSKDAEVKSEDALADQEAIEREIADAMFDCWSMMGEGKLDIFGELEDISNFVDKKPKCVICSRVAINESLWTDDEFKEKVVNELDVNEFMQTKRPSESVSKNYWDLMTGVGISAPSQEEILEAGSGESEDQVAIVFSQIITDKSPGTAAFQTAGAGFVLYGSSLAVTGLNKLTANIPAAVIALVATGGASGIAAYQTYQGQQAAAAYCGDFTSAESARKGCSVVRAVEWDANSVNGFCSGGIEGNL